jgi:hypothetical protein
MMAGRLIGTRIGAGHSSAELSCISKFDEERCDY